eukprot:SAG11_NODE_2639_length_3140_cov_3.871095_3_plen_40_part_00
MLYQYVYSQYFQNLPLTSTGYFLLISRPRRPLIKDWQLA